MLCCVAEFESKPARLSRRVERENRWLISPHGKFTLIQSQADMAWNFVVVVVDVLTKQQQLVRFNVTSSSPKLDNIYQSKNAERASEAHTHSSVLGCLGESRDNEIFSVWVFN